MYNVARHELTQPVENQNSEKLRDASHESYRSALFVSRPQISRHFIYRGLVLVDNTKTLYWMSRSRYPILGDDPLISQTSEYALRAVVCLGGSIGQPMTTAAIAKLTRVPQDYLSKVLQGLSKAGLVDSQRGVGGGFVLARSLDDLTVLDVINAVDPLKRITRCPLLLAAHRNSFAPCTNASTKGLP